MYLVSGKKLTDCISFGTAKTKKESIKKFKFETYCFQKLFLLNKKHKLFNNICPFEDNRHTQNLVLVYDFKAENFFLEHCIPHLPGSSYAKHVYAADK